MAVEVWVTISVKSGPAGPESDFSVNFSILAMSCPTKGSTFGPCAIVSMNFAC